MSERETIKFETPSQKVPVVLYAYMTGGETMDLQGISVGAGIRSVDGKTGAISMNAESAYQKRLRKLVEMIIVSIGEATSSEEKWQALRNLRSQDYNFLMTKIEQVTEGITEDEGKA